MPRLGDIDTFYPEKLKHIGIELLEPYKGSKIHHQMKCTTCNHIWSATPLAKISISYKKYGVNGCPECNKVRRETKKQSKRKINMDILKARGLEILSDYDGRYVTDVPYQSIPVMVTVKNINCGHTFTSSSKNLLTRNVKCPVCATEYRTKVLNEHVEKVHEEWAKTATEWKRYKSKVTSLTRKNYLANKEKINPNNLKVGKAGVEGAYHLDHRIPIRYCFENNISADACAAVDNLQMLDWRSNVAFKDKLK